MPISFDRVSEPPHALNRATIKAILTVVPPDWLRYIKTVHLGATLPTNCAFVRPVIYSAYSHRLNIYSRGLTLDDARKEVLRELAVHGLSIQTCYGHNLSAQELRQVDEAIMPYLDKLCAELEPESE